MDTGAKKLLESATYKTLHAHNFSRSSSQATLVLTDLLSRYMTLLTSTCAKYAEHAGRLNVSIKDTASALDELGVGVEDLKEYCASEARELSRYAVHTARRTEDLAEFNALLLDGLREDRDDAIPLVYAPMPLEAFYDEYKEEETQPPLPLSPISNPSTPPRKRPRTSSWRPPSYVPDHLPPFPTNSPPQSPFPRSPTEAIAPIPVKMERVATPPPPPMASSASSADFLTPIPYLQSSLAGALMSHLPPLPPRSGPPSSQARQPLPQMQPALLGAYHHVLTHPPPSNVTSVNPSKYRVALALLTQAEAQPRWEPAPTLFSNTVPNPPRVAAPGPSYPVPVAKGPLTPTDKELEIEKDRRSNLPNAPPRPVVFPERVTPLISQQASRLPTLARHVLPGSVYTRTTRLTHPPVLSRGAQRLTYGPGVGAPWNTNATPTPAAPTGKGKDGAPNGKDVDALPRPIPDARMYATWDYEPKRYNESLVVKRNRIGSMQATVSLAPVRGRNEHRVS
ncbi:hypothetical protein POSPLADRAFT_1155377 [Postia placenta MAD-698-R-SB12]|uniref:Bromodomain associated domain-containing protein n=1 Tax=Postia placenta MAD-698-R-SB12 TaxID=670580 RepID=A0A1X6MNK7_9APHY|nr:hypothetical protein POSPLADRAFT_1155377 [Postia placenta MAD-698-R-SB12]OSX57908.1 hypothetical protein POSPLADRAFT_1155377 [Postia placenta MAD-698-R-SB12]